MSDADHRVPPAIGVLIVVALAWPTLKRIVADARARRLSAHSLPVLGAGAALIVGTWTSAALVLILVRLADLVERAAIQRSRVAMHALEDLRPHTANVEHGDHVHTVLADVVAPGAIVVVRPGERVPVDGVIVDGTAMVDQSALTGDPLPSRCATGDHIFAASITHGGVIRIRAETVGANSAFGRVVSAVENAEADRPRLAGAVDRLARWYAPIILAVACGCWLFGRGALSAASVLIIACSCSLIVTVPIATLASIAAAARRGTLIKSGRALESLAAVDVLLIDKTGTLTAGAPVVVDVEAIEGFGEGELLELAACVEQHAPHPLARAVCRAASERDATVRPVDDFVLVAGAGVAASLGGARVAVGSERWLCPAPAPSELAAALERWRQKGFSTMVVTRDETLIGAIAVADRLRPDAEAAIRLLRAMEIGTIEILTGDHADAATALARRLGISGRGGLLPDEKLAVVQEYQRRKLTVAMIGDGTNDVLALAGADAGIAIGATGVAVASQAADLVLLRDDWMLVPDAIAMARRTMRLVRMNLAGSVLYNLVAVTLALSGHVTPVFAAAAHTIPDLGVLANSARLMRNPGRAGGGST
ncbi:MAG TPA: cation-translocating P-type ATPase [Gemmatimonadaceae bacterium]